MSQPAEAYLDIYDVVAENGELLQVRYEDRQMLPPDWMAEFVLSVLSATAAALLPTIAGKAKRRLEDVYVRIKNSRRSDDAKGADQDPRLQSIELVEALQDVPSSEVKPVVIVTVINLLTDQGVRTELAKPVAEGMARALTRPGHRNSSE